MFEKWVTSNSQGIPMVLLSTVVTYTAILLYTRVSGLRSFAKISAADFAMTIAIGSMFAAMVSSTRPPLVLGLVALASLYAGQSLLSWLRCRSSWFRKLVDNQPLLLMCGHRILDQNLERANVTRADLYSKLREANALNYEHVLAVVFETTGDISVLQSASENAMLEREFFNDVQGAELLFESGELRH